MSEPRIFVEEMGDHGDEPSLDLVCRECGGRFSLLSDESAVVQIVAFADRHRHGRPSRRQA